MTVAPTAAPAGDARLAELTARVEDQAETIRRLDATLKALARLPDDEGSLTDTKWAAPAAPTPAAVPWPPPRSAPAAAPADEEVLLAAADLISDAAVGLDAGGAVRVWNRAAARLFGWPAGEVLGGPPPFLPDDKAAEHAELLARLKAGAEVRDVPTIRRRREGNLIRVRAAAIPTSGGGSVFTYRSAEEPEPAAPALDPVVGRYVALGRALAGVAHDFNNLLSVVQGHAELLAEQAEPGSPVRAAAETIATTTDLAAGLTRHLLSVARPEPGSPPRTDVNLLLARMHRILRAIVGARVRVAVTCAAELGLAAIHPAELTQVVLNLATNARDAMADGGALTVCTAEHGEFVALTVADTGVGMDEATRARMFDEFFTTKGADGTGLGLATVRDVVTRAGGQVEVESEPGRGTRVRVLLRKA